MDSGHYKKVLNELKQIPLNLSRKYYYINLQKKKLIEEIVKNYDKEQIQAVLEEIKKEQ